MNENPNENVENKQGVDMMKSAEKISNDATITSEERNEDEVRARESVDWSVTEGELQARVSMINPTNQC